ncbi:MAG: FxsA family protein [Actinomycetota bacterium]|nr:FxsA family protein [Actinomycetota bacterium]MCL6092944.1 FxsA family protein [Actinomycetota bacterium]MDA8167724.1 FxsA family protein [Actinomycetota bacterium]
MFPRLLILFIVVPLMELLVIIEIGSRIGYLYTIVLLILISFSGAALARREGYRAIAQIQADVAAGRMPADSLIDGALILLAAALLITPGYITDVAGLALLLPPARRRAHRYVRRRVRSAAEARTFRVWTGGPPSGGSGAAGSQEPEQRRKEIKN